MKHITFTSTNNMEQKEYILCAAIHYEDGIEHLSQCKNIKTGFVISGRRHDNCIMTYVIIRDILNGEIKRFPDTQGFITNTDRFVNRAEAFKIAQAAGQLIVPDDSKENILTSEDLY